MGEKKAEKHQAQELPVSVSTDLVFAEIWT
jgi:hypothetical protein